MPNPHNISAPIMLISAGRSGTTLFSDIFDRHPDFSASGETVDLIFDLWNAGQRSISHIAASSLKDASSSVDDEVAKFTRDGFLSLMEDDKKHWFQKPIGIPFVFSHALFDVDLWDEKAELYWNTMRNVFPEAKYFTVLRHPCDIVMSYKSRFGFDERRCWAILGFLSHIICHRSSLVRYAVHYDTLVQDSETTLRALLSFLGIEFDPAMLEAFDTVHSLSAATRSSSESSFTWKNQWDDLDPSCAQQRHIEAIGRLYRKFGHDLDLPAAFVSRTSPDSSTMAATGYLVKAGQANTCEMLHYIEQLETLNENVNLMWEERAIRQDNELYQAYLKLENAQRAAYFRQEDERRDAYLSLMGQIDELTRDKEWLSSEYRAWRHVAREAEMRFCTMERQVAEMEKGKLWLEGQVAAWQASAQASEARFKAISGMPPVRMLMYLRQALRGSPQWSGSATAEKK